MTHIKTLFGHRLLTELGNEFRQMDSEWFFRWHALSYGEKVDVDRFDGQRIRVGGLRFEAGTSIELVYWEAVARYVSNKINDVFERAEQEIRVSPPSSAADLAEDAANALRPFFGRILNHAVDTDRRLKGRGYPDQNYTAPNSSKVSFVAEIERRKNSLTEFYKPPVAPTSRSERFEKFIEKNKGKLQLFGAFAAICTIAGVVGRAFGLF